MYLVIFEENTKKNAVRNLECFTPIRFPNTAQNNSVNILKSVKKIFNPQTVSYCKINCLDFAFQLNEISVLLKNSPLMKDRSQMLGLKNIRSISATALKLTSY